MAHCIGKVGEDSHHVFACLVYFFVSTLEVVQFIIGGVFLDQGMVLPNLQLCLGDFVHGSTTLLL